MRSCLVINFAPLDLNTVDIFSGVLLRAEAVKFDMRRELIRHASGTMSPLL
jgi:hypothetical protein